jgi:hypothetical protein
MVSPCNWVCLRRRRKKRNKPHPDRLQVFTALLLNVWTEFYCFSLAIKLLVSFETSEVLMKNKNVIRIQVKWDVMLCRSACGSRRFEETCTFFFFQDLNVSVRWRPHYSITLIDGDRIIRLHWCKTPTFANGDHSAAFNPRRKPVLSNLLTF